VETVCHLRGRGVEFRPITGGKQHELAETGVMGHAAEDSTVQDIAVLSRRKRESLAERDRCRMMIDPDTDDGHGGYEPRAGIESNALTLPKVSEIQSLISIGKTPELTSGITRMYRWDD
jgi:hypothetical protein